MSEVRYRKTNAGQIRHFFNHDIRKTIYCKETGKGVTGKEIRLEINRVGNFGTRACWDLKFFLPFTIDSTCLLSLIANSTPIQNGLKSSFNSFPKKGMLEPSSFARKGVSSQRAPPTLFLLPHHPYFPPHQSARSPPLSSHLPPLCSIGTSQTNAVTAKLQATIR